MKRVVLVFAIMCICQHVLCQSMCYKDSIMYMSAYRYILNDSINRNKLVAVADSIVDLDRYWMTGLEQYPEEQKKLACYREKQMKRIFTATAFYSPLLASLFHDQDVMHSNTILFFSEIADLMLRADINFFDKGYVGDYEKFNYEAYIWGISYEYLFIFNEDGTIKKVLRRELILN